MENNQDKVELFGTEGGRVARFIKNAERFVYIGVAFSLLAIALALLGYTCFHTFKKLFSGTNVIHTFIIAIQDILLVIIILEILWTVMSYIESESIPLEPFLFVAIISSLRGLILKSTSALEAGHKDLYGIVVEVGIHAVEIFVLVLALYILRRSRRYLSEEDKK